MGLENLKSVFQDIQFPENLPTPEFSPLESSYKESSMVGLMEGVMGPIGGAIDFLKSPILGFTLRMNSQTDSQLYPKSGYIPPTDMIDRLGDLPGREDGIYPISSQKLGQNPYSVGNTQAGGPDHPDKFFQGLQTLQSIVKFPLTEKILDSTGNEGYFDRFDSIVTGLGVGSMYKNAITGDTWIVDKEAGAFGKVADAFKGNKFTKAVALTSQVSGLIPNLWGKGSGYRYTETLYEYPIRDEATGGIGAVPTAMDAPEVKDGSGLPRFDNKHRGIAFQVVGNNYFVLPSGDENHKYPSTLFEKIVAGAGSVTQLTKAAFGDHGVTGFLSTTSPPWITGRGYDNASRGVIWQAQYANAMPLNGRKHYSDRNDNFEIPYSLDFAYQDRVLKKGIKKRPNMDFSYQDPVIFNWASDVWGTIKDMGSLLKSGLGGLYNMAGNFGGAVGKEIASSWTDLKKGMREDIDSSRKTLSKYFKDKKQKDASRKKITDSLKKNNWRDGFENPFEGTANPFGGALGDLSEAGRALKGWLSGLGNPFAGVSRDDFNFLPDVANPFGGMGGDLMAGLGAGKNWLTSKGFQNPFAGMVRPESPYYDQFFSDGGFENPFAGLKPNIDWSAWADNMRTKIAGSGLVVGSRKLAGAVGSGITSAAGSFYTFVKDFVQASAAGIGKIASAFGSGVKSIFVNEDGEPRAGIKAIGKGLAFTKDLAIGVGKLAWSITSFIGQVVATPFKVILTSMAANQKARASGEARRYTEIAQSALLRAKSWIPGASREKTKRDYTIEQASEPDGYRQIMAAKHFGNSPSFIVDMDGLPAVAEAAGAQTIGGTFSHLATFPHSGIKQSQSDFTGARVAEYGYGIGGRDLYPRPPYHAGTEPTDGRYGGLGTKFELYQDNTLPSKDGTEPGGSRGELRGAALQDRTHILLGAYDDAIDLASGESSLTPANSDTRLVAKMMKNIWRTALKPGTQDGLYAVRAGDVGRMIRPPIDPRDDSVANPKGTRIPLLPYDQIPSGPGDSQYYGKYKQTNVADGSTTGQWMSNSFYPGFLEGKGDIHTLQPVTVKVPLNVESPQTGYPFYFKDLRKNEFIIFRGYVQGLSENVNGSWNPENYIGRSEPVYIYQRGDRQLNFTLRLFAMSEAQLDAIYSKLNSLTSLCYPQYQPDGNMGGKTRMKPPLTRFRLGELFGNRDNQGVLGFIESISYSYPDSSPWEHRSGKRVPKLIDATISYRVIHDAAPNYETTFYGTLTAPRSAQMAEHYGVPVDEVRKLAEANAKKVAGMLVTQD